MNRAQLNILLLGATSGILGGMALDELLRDRMLRIIAGIADIAILVIIAVITYRQERKEPVG